MRADRSPVGRATSNHPRKSHIPPCLCGVFVSRFQPTKSDPLFWVKNPFSWGSNHDCGIFCLKFAQVAKSVQILLFLSNEKTQVNSLHKNQLLLHTPTKRIFYHLHPKRSTKPQLAAICSTPVKFFPQYVRSRCCFGAQFLTRLPLPRSKFLNFPRKHNVK